MSFKTASIYAGVSALVLGGLFYSDNVQSLIWIPSFFKQILITVLLIPIFTWIYTVEQFGRKEPRQTETGFYGRWRAGPRVVLYLFLVPILLIAAPPAVLGNFGTAWGIFGITVFALGCYLGVYLHLARIEWTDTELKVTSPLHLGDRVFAWQSLSDIQYKRNAHYATLVFDDAGTVRVGHYMEGYADLMAHAESLMKDA